MSTLEMLLGALGLANGWLLVNIKLQITQLELKLRMDLISKDDFSHWTKQSTTLPRFDHDQ